MGFRLNPVLFLIIGNILITNCQSLLGAVENILGIDEQPTNQNVNQRYTALPNANTKLYNYPVHNNLQGSNINLYNRDPNRNRLNTINNLANNNSNNKHNGLVNPAINLLNLGDHKNIQSGIMQKVNQGNYEDDDVKLAAQQFPGLQKLLDKLKEMNKQKELEKQQNSNNGQTTTVATITTTVNNGNSNKPISETKEKGKMKALKRRKFYFQVQPVVPEDQKKQKDMETVYYED